MEYFTDCGVVLTKLPRSSARNMKICRIPLSVDGVMAFAQDVADKTKFTGIVEIIRHICAGGLVSIWD